MWEAAAAAAASSSSKQQVAAASSRQHAGSSHVSAASMSSSAPASLPSSRQKQGAPGSSSRSTTHSPSSYLPYEEGASAPAGASCQASARLGRQRHARADRKVASSTPVLVLHHVRPGRVVGHLVAAVRHVVARHHGLAEPLVRFPPHEHTATDESAAAERRQRERRHALPHKVALGQVVPPPRVACQPPRRLGLLVHLQHPKHQHAQRRLQPLMRAQRRRGLPYKDEV